MAKYIVIKKDPSDGRIYETYPSTDYELAEHIRGTFDNTDHIILGVINTQST